MNFTYFCEKCFSLKDQKLTQCFSFCFVSIPTLKRSVEKLASQAYQSIDCPATFVPCSRQIRQKRLRMNEEGRKDSRYWIILLPGVRLRMIYLKANPDLSEKKRCWSVLPKQSGDWTQQLEVQKTIEHCQCMWQADRHSSGRAG